MQQYSLSTREGLALMCLAEALLRIPDHKTANDLIKDKVAAQNWLSNIGGTKDWMVKAAGYGLMISDKTLSSLVSKLGEPVIREAMVQAMRMMGSQFVLGRTIEEAMKRARDYPKYRMSYDMLVRAHARPRTRRGILNPIVTPLSIWARAMIRPKTGRASPVFR